MKKSGFVAAIKTNPIKPNFQKAKMNLNLYSTKDYENKPSPSKAEKQTQSNPICTELVEPASRMGRTYFNDLLCIYTELDNFKRNQ